MEILGKLYGVEAVKTGISQYSGKQWQSQNFELKITNRGKEMIVPMSAWGNTVDQLANIQIGTLVKVYFDIRGEEYQGKRYVRLESSFVESADI